MVGRAGTDVGQARRDGLRARRSLSAADRALRSSTIAGRLTQLPEVQDCRAMAGYMATADEVDLLAAWVSLAAGGVQLHLPRIAGLEEPPPIGSNGPDRSMDFARWEPGEPLTSNRYGIGEPAGDAVGVTSLDAVVLPCVAIDDHGVRVGFGAGYYDRALGALDPANHSDRPTLIGVAFDDQRRDAIAAQPWDVSVDVVVTDLVVLRPGS